MSSERDVTLIIDDSNLEWIRTLKLVQMSKSVSPAAFLYRLGEHMFPDMAFPSTPDDKEMLYSMKLVFAEYGIAQGARWSPVLKLCKVQNYEDDVEGIEAFNGLLKSLRVFFTPDQKFRKSLARNVEERRLLCQELAKELNNLADENQFYREKVQRIQAVVSGQASNSDAPPAMRILTEKFGELKRKPKRAGTADMRVRPKKVIR